MWKNEIMDTLKQTALVLSFSLLIPIIYGINSMRFPEENLFFTWYIDWGLTYLIPILTLYLAYNMFASEDSDGALEYMKSLPVNKWELLAIKILPRLAVTLVLMLIYTYLVMGHYLPRQLGVSWLSTLLLRFSLLPNAISIGFPLMVLISGFMLGISNRKNQFLVLALAIPILYMIYSQGFLGVRFSLYHFWWKLFQTDQYNHIMRLLSSVIQIYIPAMIPLVVLIPVFKSWDCSSGRARSERMLKRMAGPLGLLIVLYAVGQLHLL
ncbi:MAG: ABC transporter permease subunit [Candidatus Sabulitectum sp.]|nr:ABC transporter permease subunit [Candidatus Sabulitectum sp.]